MCFSWGFVVVKQLIIKIKDKLYGQALSGVSLVKLKWRYICIYYNAFTFYDYNVFYHYQNANANAYSKYKIYTVS